MDPQFVEKVCNLCEHGTSPDAVRVGFRSWILNWHESNFFVKRFDTPRGFNREVTTLGLLRETAVSFRHPRVMCSGPLRQKSGAFVVTDVIGRCSLATFAKRHRQTRRVTLATVGRLLLSFHRAFPHVSHDGDASLNTILHSCETHARIAAEHGETTASSLADAIRAWIEVHGLGTGPAVLCHGDLHPDNIVLASNRGPVTTETTGLVDFESSHWAPAIVDLAKSSVVCGLGDDADAEALLSGYGRMDLDHAVLIGLQAFHAMSGWIYAGLAAHRDVALWNSRLHAFGTRLSRAQEKKKQY